MGVEAITRRLEARKARSHREETNRVPRSSERILLALQFHKLQSLYTCSEHMSAWHSIVEYGVESNATNFRDTKRTEVRRTNWK